MLLIFQSLFVLFALAAVFGVYQKRRENLLSIRGMFFWIAFWVLAALVVWFPSTTSMLADRLGIGRGTDLVVYVSLACIFYVLFRLHVKLEKINRDVTKVVRRETIESLKHKNI